MEAVKNILVFSRMHITNYGDPIIGDCCKYLIEKTAAENGIPVSVSLADIYEEDYDEQKIAARKADTIETIKNIIL